MFTFIKDNIVVGISSTQGGIPDYDFMYEVQDDQKVYIGDELIDNAYVDKSGIPSYCVTKLTFMNRFSLAELGAIEVSTDPIVKVLQRQQSIADFIDLKDTKTAEGIGYLVSIGILTPTRMTEILSVV
jgi:hypothetical protein